MIKKIASITVFILAAVLCTGCEEEDYEPPFGNFSSFEWWSSPAGQFRLTEKGAKQNSFIAFQDLSRNALSHEWKIGSGTSFLESGFDENTTDYKPFKKSGTTTDDATIFVLFEQLGESEILLTNTFKDSVPNAVRENGNWTATQLFTITVTE